MTNLFNDPFFNTRQQNSIQELSKDWRDYGWLISSDDRLKFAPRVHKIIEWRREVIVYAICVGDKAYYVGRTINPTTRLRGHLYGTIHKRSELLKKFYADNLGRMYVKILYHETFDESDDQAVRITNIEHKFKSDGGDYLLNHEGRSISPEPAHTKKRRKELSELKKGVNHSGLFVKGSNVVGDNIERFNKSMSEWRDSVRGTPEWEAIWRKKSLTNRLQKYRNYQGVVKFHMKSIRSGGIKGAEPFIFGTKHKGKYEDPMPVNRELREFAITDTFVYGWFRSKHIR